MRHNGASQRALTCSKPPPTAVAIGAEGGSARGGDVADAATDAVLRMRLRWWPGLHLIRRREAHALLHLTLTYIGTRYRGLQRQTDEMEAGRHSVQHVVDDALEAAFGGGYFGCSTRLDAGVHARELRAEARVPLAALPLPVGVWDAAAAAGGG
eukprot:gene23887-62996_t